MDEYRVSIIIPTLNEAAHIERLLNRIIEGATSLIAEVIVVDGRSTDHTVALAQQFDGVRVMTYEGKANACRATQMNFGAKRASGHAFWFVHADCIPPLDYADRLALALTGGCQLGGFAFQFDEQRLLLQVNSWFTRFNWSFTCGGDQTLLISRDLFLKLGGYNPEFVIMEEYDLIDRAKAKGVSYQRLKGTVEVSARKYRHNAWLRVQLANLIAFRSYRAGKAPHLIRAQYFKQLHHPKADE